MNYEKIYQAIIERAKNRVSEGYIERHHIIPRCMGGTNSKDNLVELYPEEHFLVHILLIKIYPENLKLVNAISMMCGGDVRWRGRRKRHLYGWLKRKFANCMSESQSGRRNSQFEVRWICNTQTKVNCKIRMSDPVPDGWILGRSKWLKETICSECCSIFYLQKLKSRRFCSDQCRKTFQSRIGRARQLGKPLSMKARQAVSRAAAIAQKGQGNSQYGTCWISHELVGPKKCKRDLLPFYIDQGWVLGRSHWRRL